MRTILMAGAAAISMAAIPVTSLAQSDVPGSTNSISDKRAVYEMSEEQKGMYDSWPAEKQSEYESWPYDYQVYYWDLDPMYQPGFWALTPEQRTKIYSMEALDQETAWKSVMAQLNGETVATAETSSGDVATSYQNSAVVQGNMTAEAKDEYPVCKGDIQDSCINPRAAGMNWGNRPLDYWPGKPASEM